MTIAITFDLWDTVFHDDSDEPKRAAAGLPNKKVSRRDLVHCFDCLVFSDEAGWSKPAPALFARAAEGLGVPVTRLVHIGDRESKDAPQ